MVSWYVHGLVGGRVLTITCSTLTWCAVCDDHTFKDDRLFYRFRRDDGSYQGPPDPPVVAKGQRLYTRCVSVVCHPVGEGGCHLVGGEGSHPVGGEGSHPVGECHPMKGRACTSCTC